MAHRFLKEIKQKKSPNNFCEDCKRVTTDLYPYDPITHQQKLFKRWCRDCYENSHRRNSEYRF